MCRTTANEFLQIAAFQVNPSPAPRELPLHKGAMGWCDFRLSAAEKAKGKFKTSTPKTAENRKSRTLPQALRASRPYRKGAMGWCDFRLCTAEKAEAKVKVSKPKAAEKRKSRTLLQSPPATAPSRREPVFVRVFSLCCRKARTKTQALKTESLHFSLFMAA